MLSPSSREPPRTVAFPGWWLAGLIAAAAAGRAWLHFRTPLAPGINGAYYYVQARAVLEHGLPGVPDLPLTFWVHAGLAWLVQHLAGLDRESAVVLAVKCADSLLPALAALPVAWLGWRWQRAEGQPSRLAALAPAAFVCLGAQALSMTGDFEKNSLALVWLAAFAPAAHVFLSRPGGRTALAPLGLLALLGLTHVGVLGATLIFAALLAAAATLGADRAVRRRILALALGGVVVLGIAGTIIYRTYDPGRVTRLIRAFTEPSTFVDNQDPAGANRGPRPGLDGPGGGPPGSSGLLRWAPSAAFVAVALAGLGVAWRRRRSLAPADRTVLVAAALTTAALGGPFYGMDKAQRLMLIAAVPAAMTLSFLLAAMAAGVARRVLGGLVIAVTVASAAFYLPYGGQPTISSATYAELKTLATYTTPAERSLVVARHGLEWWTAWTLHTHIAQPQAVKATDWAKFDRVLYLTEKKQQGGPGGGLPPFGGGQPPRGPRQTPDDPTAADDDMGPPSGGPPIVFPGGPGGGPARMMAQIPANASILHDGAELKLAVAPTPPEKGANTRR